MTLRRLRMVFGLVCCFLAVAPLSAVQAQQAQRQPQSICSLAQGQDSRLCIIDGQIRNLEGQLLLARSAGARGVSQPQSFAASIRTLEERLRVLKARRALLAAGAARGVTLVDDDDDEGGILLWLPLLALALMMGGGGGGGSSTGGGSGPVTSGSDGIPSFQGDGVTDVGGEPVSPS